MHMLGHLLRKQDRPTGINEVGRTLRNSRLTNQMPYIRELPCLPILIRHDKESDQKQQREFDQFYYATARVVRIGVD